jgi:hypothetical protein
VVLTEISFEDVQEDMMMQFFTGKKLSVGSLNSVEALVKNVFGIFLMFVIFASCDNPKTSKTEPEAAPKQSESGATDSENPDSRELKICSSLDDVQNHINSNENEPEAFCFHKVEDPTRNLETGRAIRAEEQLSPGVELAFLNKQRGFVDAKDACKSIDGDKWSPPESASDIASPRAASASHSFEAMVSYLGGHSWEIRTDGHHRWWFWSGSYALPLERSCVMAANLISKVTFSEASYGRSSVVCLKRK